MPILTARRRLLRMALAGAVALPLFPALGPAGRDTRAETSRDPSSAAAVPARPGADAKVGRTAPPLRLARWINSERLEIDRLRGRVLLVRWWTDTCPYCEATAPALRALDRKYRDRGLVVIGVFHPKPPDDGSLARVRRAAERFEFTFPVALDADWKALRRWWLSGVESGWTSITFVVDRGGVIRLVHPGGEFHEGGGGEQWPDHSTCRAEYREIEEMIESLLGP